MAEIPKFKGTPVYNQPIGVVQPMRDTSGEAFQRIGQALFEHDYAKVYAAEETKGKAFGASAAFGQGKSFGKGKDGGLLPITIPENFSTVARTNALSVGDKRYITQLTLDAQKHANILHADHEKSGDYAGFQAKWKAYSEGTLERLSSDPSLSKYAASIAAALDAEGFSHGKKLYADRVGIEHKQSFVNDVQLIESAIRDQQQMVVVEYKEYESGDVVFDSDASLKNILSKVDELEELYPTLMERGMLQTLKDSAKTQHFLGKLNNVSSLLIQNIGDNLNAYSKDIPISDILKSAQVAIRTGNMDNIRNQLHRNLLDDAGLSNVINTSGFGDVQDKLASSMDSVENLVKEQAQANKDNLLLSVYSNTAMQGGILSADQTAHVLKIGAGIGSPQELLNALPSILQGSPDNPVYQALTGSSQLPPIVTNAFTVEMMEGYIAQNGNNPMALITMRNFFKKATHRMRDGRLDVNLRGFSDETFLMFEAMDAIANTPLYNSFTPRDVLNARQKLRTDPLMKDQVNIEMGGYMKTDSGRVPSTIEFVRDATGTNDVGVNAHFTRYADELVLTFGAEQAHSIIKNSVDKIFKKSDYMFAQGGQQKYTRMAPEQAYRREGEMDIILTAAQAKLQLSPKGSRLTIGKDAFFAPTTGTAPIKGVPTNLPSYRLVDKNGQVLLDNNSQPLVVGPQAVLTAKGIKDAKDIEEYEAKARKSLATHLDRTDMLGRPKPIKRGGDFSGAFGNSRMTLKQAQALRDKRDQDRANK